ncbi:hypothetical protein Bca101_056632 [Brassica carinata]
MNLNNVDGQANHKAVVNGFSTLSDPMVLTSLDDILIRVKFEDTNKNLKENQTSSIGIGKLKGNTTRQFKKTGSSDKNPKGICHKCGSISSFNIMI